MVKRQKLLQFTITLLTILALAVGIIFATGIDFGAKGGDIIEGGGTAGFTPSAPFADMPDAKGYVEVTVGDLDAAKSVNYSSFDKEGQTLLVKTAPQFAFVFSGIHNDKTFKLMNDFIIADPTFLFVQRLNLRGSNLVVDGNGKNVISKYTTSVSSVPMPNESDGRVYKNAIIDRYGDETSVDGRLPLGKGFGGMLGYISTGATVKNLNYYLDPTSMLIVAYTEGKYVTIKGASPVFDVTSTAPLSHVRVGGFVGQLDGSISNCNFNIYGTVFGLRMGNTGDFAPLVGGVIGQNKGTVTNSVFNVINATVSGSSHVNKDDGEGFKHIGGVAGINRGVFKNNVFNVSPSSIISADIMGYTSNNTDNACNHVGTYFGSLLNEAFTNTYYDNNTFINYNNIFGKSGSTSGTARWQIPVALGNKTESLDSFPNSKYIAVNGGSLFGDDFKVKVDTAGNMHQYVNGASLTSELAGYTDITESGNPLKGWKTKDGVQGGTFEFYEEAKYKDTDGTYLIKDSYTWNRLVSLSGTAYYDGSGKVVDALSKLSGVPTTLKDLRNKANFDTKANGGRVLFDSYAAPAFLLKTRLSGNNGTAPEDNVVDMSNMTRRSGVIQKYEANGKTAENEKAGFYNLSIINKTIGIQDGGAVHTYVGGIVDNLDENVNIDNCIINNEFIYVKNGISQQNMVSTTNPDGDLYYGGAFGRIAGDITNSYINSNTDLHSDLLRLGNNSRRNTVHLAGFAGEADNIIIKNSIINTHSTKLSTKHPHMSLMAGFAANVVENLDIDNSQIGVYIDKAIGGEKKWGSATRSDTSTLAGFVSQFSAKSANFAANPLNMDNTRLDMHITTTRDSVINTHIDYLVGRLNMTGDNSQVKFAMNNVAINMNEQFGWLDDNTATDNTNAEELHESARSLFNTQGKWVNSNVWVYNASKAGNFAKDVAKDTYNTISIAGNAMSGGKKQIMLSDVHDLALLDKDNNPTRSLADITSILSSTKDINAQAIKQGAKTYANAMGALEFYVEPSAAFYDMRRMDATYRKYYTEDRTIERPHLISKNDPALGVKSYTAANIGWGTALSDSAAGLGWFSGATPQTLDAQLKDAGYTATVAPVLSKNDNGEYIEDKSTGTPMYVVDEYQYSLKVNAGDKGKHITALLSTYSIKDSAEWNQVAKNINAGFSHKNIPVRVANNITASSGLIAMGTADHPMDGSISGVELIYDNPDFDEDKAVSPSNPKTLVYGYPLIDAKAIVGAGTGNIGLIGYLTGSLNNINIKGADLQVPGSDIKADDLDIAEYPYLNIGTIAGTNKGSIDNVHVIGTVSPQYNFKAAKDVRFGLLVGYNATGGTINNCSYIVDKDKKLSFKASNTKPVPKGTPTINPIIYVGGAVGVNEGGNIIDTVTNIGQYSFTKGAYVAAGGIGNYISGNVNGLYVSVQASTFDSTMQTTAVAGFGAMGKKVVIAYPDDATVYAGGALNAAKDGREAEAYTGKRVRIYSKDASIANRAQLVFSPMAEGDGINRNFKIEIVSTGDFAVAEYAFGDIKEFDTTYINNINEITLTKYDGVDIVVSLIGSNINNVGEWNEVARLVNDGSTFRSYEFNVMADLTFDADNLPNMIGGGDKAFQGTINGAGHKIFFKGEDKAPTFKALIGLLGEDGVIRDLDIQIVSKYTSDSSVDDVAIVVAHNRGLIENINLNINSVAIGPVMHKIKEVVLSGKNVGLLVGNNAGKIRSVKIVTEPNFEITDKPIVSIVGNNAGMLAGISTVEVAATKKAEPLQKTFVGDISGVEITTASVKVSGKDAQSNIGILMGVNVKGAKMDSVVNTMLFDHSKSGVYHNSSTDYFVANVEDAADIKNVWILLNNPMFAIDDAPSADYKARPNNSNATLRYNDKLFNVMYNYQLNNNSGNIKATASNNSIIFEVANDEGSGFYGYVSDFDHAKTDNPNKKLNVKNVVGQEYAAIFANTEIANAADLSGLSAYTGEDAKIQNANRLINGIVFKVADNAKITLDLTSDSSKVNWAIINEFNHILSGGTNSSIVTSTSVKAEHPFEGLFGTITASGGIENITFDMAGTVDGASVAGLIANENYGRISNISFVSNGVVKADPVNGTAGMLVGNNYGIIESVNVNVVNNVAYNDVIAPEVSAHYAGIIAGKNNGFVDAGGVQHKAIINESTVKLGSGAILSGNTIGGIVAVNGVNGVIDDRGEIDAVVLTGNMSGQMIGGVAGENDGVINNIKVLVNGWGTRTIDAKNSVEFGGIAGINRGIIANIVSTFTADSTSAGLNRIAGIAVASVGAINKSKVFINNAPFVAENIAAGAVCVTETTGGSSVIDGIKVPNIMFGIQVNIANKISADNAVGFVYNNSAKVNNVFINIDNNIIGNSYASMLGYTVSGNNNPTNLVDYANGAVRETAFPINNNHIVIMGSVCPTVISPLGHVNATYVNNKAKVVYNDAWLVRVNNYHIDKGSVSLNEYKHIADGAPKLNKAELLAGKLSIVSNSSGSNVPQMLENGVEMSSGEVTNEGSIYTFTPDTSRPSNNRVVVFTQYNLDIDNKSDLDTLNSITKQNDLFYDVDINLKADITIDDASFTPFGSIYAFNSTFAGNGHTITLNSSIATPASGLFSEVGRAGVIKDLILNVGSENKVVEIGGKNAEYAGGLAGIINGKISNVAVKIYNTDKIAADGTAMVPSITASTMSGAFAGVIDNDAVLDNAWVFMQGGRYAPANGARSLEPSPARNNTYNVVNLGGTKDVDIAFFNVNNASEGFNIIIDSNYLDDDRDMNELDWLDNGSKMSIANKKDIVHNLSVFHMPAGKTGLRYSVSLIKNTISNIQGLLDLSKIQSGFNISPDEVFELAPSDGSNTIVVSAESIASYEPDLYDEKTGTAKFYAIGSSTTNRDFKSTFNGNGCTIIFEDDVVITESNEELAGLFGRIGASANINNLRVVINTNRFLTNRFAGGLAGNNKSANINNVIVEINSAIDPKLNFGGIFGDTDDGLAISGVYLVKDYDQDIAPTAKNKLQGTYNIINRYRGSEFSDPERKQEIIEEISFDFKNKGGAVKANAYANDIVVKLGSAAIGAPYYGLIDTTSDIANGKGVKTIANIGAIDSHAYAAVFVKTVIGPDKVKANNITTIKDVAINIDRGFNVRWLEYILDCDVEFSGTAKEYLEVQAMSSLAQNAFKGVFNGNGHTITLRYVNILGQGAGLFGYIDEVGVVENVIIDVANVTSGHAADAKLEIVGTDFAGMIAGVNNGTIKNAVVYDNGTDGVDKAQGNKFVGTSNIIVGKNTKDLINVWLVQNNKDTKTVVDKAVNIMNVVGNNIKGITFGVNKEGRITANIATGKAYVYNMAAGEMSKDLNNRNLGDVVFPEYQSVLENRNYVLTDFSLVLTNAGDYAAFVDRVNNGNTSFYGVEVSIANNIKDGKLILGDIDIPTPSLIQPVGTEKRPFDGIFNGNNKKFIINANVVIYGDKYSGIFGKVSNNGVIKNVEIYMYGSIVVTPLADTTDPERTVYSPVYAGIIASNSGSVENVIMLATSSMQITVDTAGIKKYTEKQVLAGGIGETTKSLYNTWYVRATDTNLVASTSKVQLSNINTLTLVGKIHQVNTAIENNEIIFTATEDKQHNIVGKFYESFATSTSSAKPVGTEIRKKNASGLVYEWVNYKEGKFGAAGSEQPCYNLENAEDFAQLAQDTKGGYNFNGRVFQITNTITLPATKEYSLGAFGGTLQPAAPSTAKSAQTHIEIVNNYVSHKEITGAGQVDKFTVENDADFVLIDELTKTGYINGVNITIGGVDCPLYYDRTTDRAKTPQAIVVNVNNGTIGNIKDEKGKYIISTITANVVTNDQISDFAILVGTNNNIVNNIVLNVSTVDNSEYKTAAVPAINVTNMYGHLAVVNTSTIENVTVNAANAKVIAGDGDFAYVVAKNLSKGGGTAKMTDVALTIDNNSTIKASNKNISTYVAGLAAFNSGKIERSSVEIVGLPEKMSYFFEGYYASFFIGKNDGGVANYLYADMSNVDVESRSHYDGSANATKNQVAGFLNAAYSNNNIDMNEGATENGNIIILMDDSDAELLSKINNVRLAKVMVKVGTGKVSVITKDKGVYKNKYQFKAEDAADLGNIFNGWFNYGDNKPLKEVEGNAGVFEITSPTQVAYEAVFYQTQISEETHWNDMAKLVNDNKNIENVVFELTQDIELKTPVVAGISAEAPYYHGKINGNDHKVTSAGDIEGEYAGLFGYVDGGIIANLNVELKKNNKDTGTTDPVSIVGSKAAGIMVASAVNGTIIGSGSFNNNIFTEDTNHKLTVTNDVNGVVEGGKGSSVGGAVGNIVGGSMDLVHVDNNGRIVASEEIGAYAGGVVGRAVDTKLTMASVINTNEIRGNKAGGIVGSFNAAGGNIISNFSVKSYSETSMIVGSKAGGLAGELIGTADQGTIKFANTSLEAQATTKAIIPSMIGATLTNTWTVVRPIDRVLDSNIGAIDPKHSIRVIRTADVKDVDYIAERVDGKEVFESKIQNDNKFDYWSFSDGTSIYEARHEFFTPNGIRKVDESFDITLERRNTITTLDHVKALAYFAQNEKAKARTSKATYCLGASLDLTGLTLPNYYKFEGTGEKNNEPPFTMSAAPTPITTIDLLGYTLNGMGKSVLTIDNTTSISNGALDDLFISIKTGGNKANVKINPTTNVLTLKAVTLVNSDIYTADTVPARTDSPTQFTAAQGNFDMGHIKPGTSVKITSEVKFVTRDVSKKDSPQTSVIVGNVPLYINDEDAVAGYKAGNDYGHYEFGKNNEKDNVTYYFVDFIGYRKGSLDQNNKDKATAEIDYLLKNGYTFAGKTIGVHMDIDIPIDLQFGTTDGTPFQGTFDGQGHTLTFASGYKSLFANLGATGTIKNFVVVAPIALDTPLFQGNKKQLDNGILENVILINTGSNKYIEGTTGYNNVVLIQGVDAEGTNNFTGKTTAYNLIQSLYVDSTLGNVADIVKITDTAMKTLDYLEIQKVNFLIESNVSNANPAYMFSGFYDNDGALVYDFVSGIDMGTITSITNFSQITMHIMNGTITDDASWNNIAKELGAVDTDTETINISADITLSGAVTGPLSSGERHSATINGNGHKITLDEAFGARFADTADADMSLFNGYTGTIKNMVIDATAAMLSQKDLVKMIAKTTFENVVIIVAYDAAAYDPQLLDVTINPLINVIVGNDVTASTGIDARVLTFTGQDATSLLHITDETGNAVMKSASSVYAEYGVLDLTKKTDHRVFIVEKITALSNVEQLHSLNNVSNPLAIGFATNSDLIVSESVELNNNNVTINAAGGRMVVNNGVTFTLNGANMSNVIINGTGNVALKSGNIDTAIITANVTNTESTGITNVWVNTKQTDSKIYSIDLSGAYNGSEELFTIKFVPGGAEQAKFTITFVDSANEYFVGMSEVENNFTEGTKSDAGITYDLVDADSNPANNNLVTFEYISNVIEGAGKDAMLAAYNNIVTKVNASPYLTGKTFYVDGVLVLNKADVVTALVDKTIVLDGQKTTGAKIQSIKMDEINKSASNALAGVTIVDMVLDIATAGEGALQATVGNNVVVVTNDDSKGLTIANTLPDAIYTIVRVMNYDQAGNTYVYSAANGVISIVNTSNTSFYAKDLANNAKVSSIKIDELLASVNGKATQDEKNVNIMFYLPISVTAANATENVIKSIVGQDFAFEVKYDESRKTNKDVIIPINLTNIVIYGIKGAKVEGLAALEGTTDARFITGSIDGNKAIDLVLDIDRLYVKKGDIKDVEHTYLDTFDSKVELHNIVNYTVRQGMTFEHRVDGDHPADLSKANAGTYVRVIEFKDSSNNVVGELHYNFIIHPYMITDKDVKMMDAEYVNDGSIVIKPNLALEEDIKDADGSIKRQLTFLGKLDEATRNDIMTKLNALEYSYVNYSVGTQNVRFKQGFVSDNGNYKLANDTMLKGAITKRVININIDSYLGDRQFDHRETGNTIFSGLTFDELLANATVDVDGVQKPLVITNPDGSIVLDPAMAKYRPAKAYEVPLRDSGAKTYLYVEQYNGRILDVKYDEYNKIVAHNIVSNIAPSGSYDFRFGDLDKNNVISGKSVKVTPAEYNITMEDNTVGYGKHYLANIDIKDQNFNNIISKDGKALEGLSASMDYLMWDDISTVVNGTRIYTIKPLVDATIVGALNTVVIRTSTTVIPARNYTIVGANVDVAKNTITGGQFHVENADINVALNNASKKIRFSGNVPSPSVDIKYADSYNNAGLSVEIAFLDENGVEIAKSDLASKVVKVGKYDIAIKVKSAVTGEYVTEYINNTNTDNSVADKDSYFETSFDIVQANASAYMNATNKPIEITYGDPVLDVKKFMYFVSDSIDALIGGENPVFDLQLTVKNEKGEVVDYTDKLPAGKYTIEYDPANNAELEANAHVIMKGGKKANLVIGKRTVNITMTVKGEKTITYGDAFLGHDTAITIDTPGAKVDEEGNMPQTDWQAYVDPTVFVVGYKTDDEGKAAIVAGETIFNAGERKFTKDDLDIVLDANHVLGKLNIESIKVVPKEVEITLSSDASASKYYGQAGNVQSTLDGYILVDGVAVDNISANYAYADVIGSQDVTLVSINSSNYIMTNDSPVYTGILTVNKTPYNAKIRAITYNETNNNTSIVVKATVGDGVSESATILVDGIIEGDEEIIKIVNDYLVNNKGVAPDLYVLKINNKLPEPIVEDEFEPIMPYIMLGILGLCAVMAVAFIIASVVKVHTMPSGFNKDFNFSRDPGKKDTDNLMKAVGKRRGKEYKAASKQMAKAAKKGTYYNVEKDIFPEDTDDTSSVEETQEDNE